MRLAIVSDAWIPQVNGVVRTLSRLVEELTGLGHDARMVTPDKFRTVPCPTYAEIRLAVLPGRRLARLLEEMAPTAIHIATEGPLGLAARNYCQRRGIPFTTAYHTRFPEYVSARSCIPLSWSYGFLRWFHRPSRAVMVTTGRIADELAARGFAQTRRWGRGVDTDLFRPRGKDGLSGTRPILLYVGRVAIEKNIAAFMALTTTGTKVVVGDGPLLDSLRRRHPEVRFVGALFGEELARAYSAADVFVFPSRTDTFGLVMLEALACGVPVAAYPVPGPLDVVGDAPVGALDDDLGRAVAAALTIPPERCRDHAAAFSWRRSAEQFLANLAPFTPARFFPACGDKPS